MVKCCLVVEICSTGIEITEISDSLSLSPKFDGYCCFVGLFFVVCLFFGFFLY